MLCSILDDTVLAIIHTFSPVDTISHNSRVVRLIHTTSRRLADEQQTNSRQTADDQQTQELTSGVGIPMLILSPTPPTKQRSNLIASENLPTSTAANILLLVVSG